jgi:hypothetical protein
MQLLQSSTVKYELGRLKNHFINNPTKTAFFVPIRNSYFEGGGTTPV